jgi:phosphoglycerate kinase
MRSIRDLAVRGKRVLVREDFNVPLEAGRIVDDTRVRAALPTLRYLVDAGARVIVVTHLGRPDGQVVETLRVTPIAVRLSELLGQPVRTTRVPVGTEAETAARALRNGEVLMLENIRFCAGETENDPQLARQLAALAELYVDDAFGTAHRAHASTVGVAELLPNAAGFLLQREVEALDRVLHHPVRPLVAIIGGSKISTKIGVLRNLVPRVEALCLGGAMANTFFKAQGLEVGRSLVEFDQVPVAREIEAAVRHRGVAWELPRDVVVAAAPTAGEAGTTVPIAEIPADRMVVDIGPATVQTFGAACARARTILWNGPLGVYEVPAFARGTEGVAQAVAASPAVSVVGGGDLVAALQRLGLTDRITHVSTGGGATLEYLEGKSLPGIAVLHTEVRR